MADRIRLGIIGANIRSHWASRSHFPALLASPDWEVTAVCTTRQQSAEEARVKLNAKLAFDGSEGTLAATGEDAPQHTEVRLYGARGGNQLRELEVPSRFACVGKNMPVGEPYNVGQMDSRFAQAIRAGQGGHPDFDTAVGLHRFLDDIRCASDTGKEISVG